jgi:hypothetical protein
MADVRSVLERLHSAINRHDIEAFISCFHPDYHSEQPAHPSREFGSSDQVRKNWSALFDDMPDFHADLVRATVYDDTVWSEWDWRGTHRDGTLAAFCGVTIFGVQDSHIIWGRLYMEPVEEAGGNIDDAVGEWTKGSFGSSEE